MPDQAKKWPPRQLEKRIEHALETIIFTSRWLLAPLYLGLIASIALLVLKFIKELWHLFHAALFEDSGNLIVGVLSLVDLVMIANLLILIIFAGYENFVSKIDTASHEDRPDWMGLVSFSDLKMKIIGSIVAISAIELLKSFMNLKEYSDGTLAWKVGIHLTFVVSGVLFAIMDRTAGHAMASRPRANSEPKEH